MPQKKMSYNPFDVEPNELVSESLQDMLPNEETSTTELENIFILVSLLLEDGPILNGNLLGIEFGDNPRLDIKVLTQNCFNFISEIIKDKKKVKSVYLIHGDEVIEVSGPFSVSCLKIVEMDYQNRACVLAIDLSDNRP
jgi:hypothetical protein